jgi:hypothetical protein
VAGILTAGPTDGPPDGIAGALVPPGGAISAPRAERARANALDTPQEVC